MAGPAVFVATPQARAQSAGLLPSNASDVNLGNLRQLFDSALSTQPPTIQRGFTVTPAITVS